MNTGIGFDLDEYPVCPETVVQKGLYTNSKSITGHPVKKREALDYTDAAAKTALSRDWTALKKENKQDFTVFFPLCRPQKQVFLKNDLRKNTKTAAATAFLS